MFARTESAAQDCQDRRTLLKRSVRTLSAATLLGVLGGCQSRAETVGSGLQPPGTQLAMAGLPTDDGGLLNYVLASEHEVIAAYGAAISGGLMLHPVLDATQQFLADHRKHAELLVTTISKAGSGAVKARSVAEYNFPLGTLRTQSDVVRFLAAREKASADAYLAVVPQFINRDLARTAASILGTETMHWAVLLGAVGDNAVPAPFLS